MLHVHIMYIHVCMYVWKGQYSYVVMQTFTIVYYFFLVVAMGANVVNNRWTINAGTYMYVYMCM